MQWKVFTSRVKKARAVSPFKDSVRPKCRHIPSNSKIGMPIFNAVQGLMRHLLSLNSALRSRYEPSKRIGSLNDGGAKLNMWCFLLNRLISWAVSKFLKSDLYSVATLVHAMVTIDYRGTASTINDVIRFASTA